MVGTWNHAVNPICAVHANSKDVVLYLLPPRLNGYCQIVTEITDRVLLRHSGMESDRKSFFLKKKKESNREWYLKKKCDVSLHMQGSLVSLLQTEHREDISGI